MSGHVLLSSSRRNGSERTGLKKTAPAPRHGNVGLISRRS
ncbi:hypothetical protein BSIN_1852 [Burkholderia singularis]|uniref:Uncharacterized protein n=1 Tax=Burkholderia singularis TaxID=1503053 RepID=A0A238H007_9BURK|nr:hypothetical protein BSIN_1852 [Burkholderia singularis]